jgi:hypothetical protein
MNTTIIPYPKHYVKSDIGVSHSKRGDNTLLGINNKRNFAAANKIIGKDFITNDDSLYELQLLAAEVFPAYRPELERCIKASLQRSRQYSHVDSHTGEIIEAEKNGAKEIFRPCKMVWLCGRCYHKASKIRRAQLLCAAERWVMASDNNRLALITYDVPHDKSTDLLRQASALTSAYRKLKKDRPYSRIRQKYGIYGTAKSLEYIYSKNTGHHLHIHELAFIQSERDSDSLQNGLKEEISNLWTQYTSEMGLGASKKYGIDVIPIDAEHAGYICKGVYLRDASAKSAWGLLEDYGNGDYKAKPLFLEYAVATKGKQSLSWSRGLKEELTSKLGSSV